MQRIPVLCLRLIVLIILMSAPFTLVAESEAAPPFRSGEVVIAGAPGPHLDGLEIKKYLPHANLTVVKVGRGKEFASVQRFKALGRKAGLNYIVRAASVPNDPLYPQQWNFTSVQSEDAWGYSTGSGVIVAVLDSGIASGANDGLDCIVYPWDFVNNDDSPDDGHGHGTHVSGTIAQATGNGIGVAGLAYDACIMPLKVLDDTGEGAFADVADAVHYAVDHGARVINMSLGLPAYVKPIVRNDPILDPELNYAYDNNVTVVCSAGNEGDYYDKNVSYPAIYPTTIAVGATDINKNVTQYSNKGEGLDLVAPGGDTTNGILQETKEYGVWKYEPFWGTSMASPHVAAVAAMLISVDPSLTPYQIKQKLTTTALDLNVPGRDTTSGYGLVQAHNALISLDTDGDGMPDGWEINYGLNPDDSADANTDFDSDGLTNLYEYNLGSDPTDSADAALDYDGDGLSNLEEYNAGTEPLNFDTDNDGVGDGFDGDPLDPGASACPDLIRNDTSLEVFSYIQDAINDPNAVDSNTIQITAADFGEAVTFDRDATLIISGGFYCSFSDNPSSSSVSSLTIRNGTVIVENLVIM